MASDHPDGAGDPRELGLESRWALVAPHREQLLAIARRRCATPEDAEDCVQEAMVRTVAHPRLDPERAAALATTITQRLSVDLVRRRCVEHRGRPRLAMLPEQAAAPPDEATLDEGEARWLAGPLNRLPERERQVFEHRAAGFSVTETATRLQLSYKAVESAFTRARNRLRLWAITAGWLLAERLRRARNRPALMAAALVASAGCLIGGTLSPGAPQPSGKAGRNPAGTFAAAGPAGIGRFGPGAGTPQLTARVPAPRTSSRASGAGGPAGSPAPSTPRPDVSVHTGPVQGPPPTQTGIGDLGIDASIQGDPVAATTDCISRFSFDPRNLGCPQ